MRDDVSLKKMFVLSILLHLLLLLIPLKMFIEDAREAQAQELEKEREDQREMSFIFVETPETATESEHQEPTPFISDKTLAAANPEAPADLPAGQPYQPGRQSEIAVMSPEQPQQQPGAPPRPPQREQSRRQQQEEGSEQQEQPGEQSSFDGLRELEALSRLAPRRQEQPLPSQPDLQQPPGAPGNPAEAPRFDNRRTRAPMGADFQLSTYNWNWAPYLKELKKRIESNIYPPPAFFMGMARGRTFLRFSIQKDGTITNFEMITYTGHESLMKTSVNSIEASVPFLPLPSDFPENELGITCGFYYNEFMQERP